MINLTFELNNQPMSALKFGAQSLPAFSGLGSYVNKRATMCVSGFGAIPIGTYYILTASQEAYLVHLKTSSTIIAIGFHYMPQMEILMMKHTVIKLNGVVFESTLKALQG